MYCHTTFSTASLKWKYTFEMGFAHFSPFSSPTSQFLAIPALCAKIEFEWNNVGEFRVHRRKEKLGTFPAFLLNWGEQSNSMSVRWLMENIQLIFSEQNCDVMWCSSQKQNPGLIKWNKSFEAIFVELNRRLRDKFHYCCGICEEFGF